MKPSSKPKASQNTVITAAAKQWRKHRGQDTDLPKLFIVGVPGYYWKSMGDPKANDRGIYDDALFVFSENVFASFNANTDPSRFKKGVATLLPGVYPYKLGNHGISRPGGGYPALRPATKNEELPVKRDGEDEIPSARPGVAINHHMGGYNTTSSEGCQTLYPTQWLAYYHLVKSEMKRLGLKRVEYILLDPAPLT